MRKYVFLVLVLLLAVSPAFASVGIQDDGTQVGQAADLNIVGETTATFDGSVKTIDITAPTSITTAGDVTFRTSLLANGRVGASSTLASSSTTLIPSTLPWCFIAKAVSGAGTSYDNDPGTRLPAGTPGKVMTFSVVALKTGGTWKVSPDKNVMTSGWQSILFDTKGDNATFLYVNDTVGWIITSQAGCTITQENLNWPP